LFTGYGLVATVLVKLLGNAISMDPMLKVPEGRRTHNSWKRALLIGLTILLFMMIFARFGELATVITAPIPEQG
jgi:hypothetical protein